jgi:hypothetical protein
MIGIFFFGENKVRVDVGDWAYLSCSKYKAVFSYTVKNFHCFHSWQLCALLLQQWIHKQNQ